MYRIIDFEKSGRMVYLIKKLISTVIYVIIIPIIIINITILLKSYITPNILPSILGIKTFVIVSKSMEPTIMTGDAIFTKEAKMEKLKINDVITFHDNKDINTHRIIGIINENGITKYVTKGDNNKNPDRNKITFDKIEGVYQFRLPGFGKVTNIIKNKNTLIILLIFLIIIALNQVKNSRKKLLRKERRYLYNKTIKKISNPL